MKYTDIQCPVCGERFTENDDVVVCPVCGTPHHRECWKANGKCVNAEKHDEGFVWQRPAESGMDNNLSNRNSDIKICPKCGEKNAIYEPVCTRCGERLKANRQTIQDVMPAYNPRYGRNSDYQNSPNPDNFSPYQNVYAADARTLYGDETKIDDIPVTEIAEYIQKDSNKYIGKFLNMEKKNTKISWNWSAGIFSVFWCFYRKITGAGFAVIALLISALMLSSVVPTMIYEKYQPEVYEQYVQDFNDLSKQMQSVADGEMTQENTVNFYKALAKVFFSKITMTTYIMLIALTLIINVTFGFIGNNVYKKKIIKDIKTLRGIASDSMSYHIYIRQRGGVSIANVILPIVIYLFFNMLRSYF